MNKTTSAIIAVVAVAVIAVGAVLLFGNKNDDSAGSNNTSTSTSTSTNTSANQQTGFSSDVDGAEPSEVEGMVVALTYTKDGFSPRQVTVPAGGTLKIVNESNKTTAPSSDNHPTHTLNPELNFPDIRPGQSATMVLTKTGTWGIHDHYDADKRATVVVE